MDRKKYSMTHAKQGITKYVSKSISKFTSASNESGSTGKNKSPSSSTGALKRMHQVPPVPVQKGLQTKDS